MKIEEQNIDIFNKMRNRFNEVNKDIVAPDTLPVCINGVWYRKDSDEYKESYDKLILNKENENG